LPVENIKIRRKIRKAFKNLKNFNHINTLDLATSL